jgi:hypothetical protein
MEVEKLPVMSFNIKYSGKYMSSNSDYYDISGDEPTSEIARLNNKILNLEFIVKELTRSISDERKT